MKHLNRKNNPLFPDPVHIKGEKESVPVDLALSYNETYSSNPPTLVGSVEAGIGQYDVQVDEDWTLDSYYCVTTKARYNLEEFLNFEDREFDEDTGAYEDFRFIQNCVGPIAEDISPPRKTPLNSGVLTNSKKILPDKLPNSCLLYTSDAADE